MTSTPKYMRIVEWTIEQINSGFQPKAKFLSESELGKRFDCSPSNSPSCAGSWSSEGYFRIQGSGTFISPVKRPIKNPSVISRNGNKTVGLISDMDNYIFPLYYQRN